MPPLFFFAAVSAAAEDEQCSGTATVLAVVEELAVDKAAGFESDGHNFGPVDWSDGKVGTFGEIFTAGMVDLSGHKN